MKTELPNARELEQRVFQVNNAESFRSIALEVYHFQFAFNPVFQAYCRAISRTPDQVIDADQIPFLPISFFKSHEVAVTGFEPELVFTSSGTTGASTSRHLVRSSALYERSFLSAFRQFFGDPAGFCVLGLLPSYLERQGSSLIYMVNKLISLSAHPRSGFYLDNFAELHQTLREQEQSGGKTILFGVTYALLDFAAAFPIPLKNTLVMDTGGMKGRRKEMVREEVDGELKSAFGLDHVHSEYGMTELLSQAYALDGKYRTPPWMKVSLRDETDPLGMPSEQGSGAINVTDLANIYSCSFIATEDAGRMGRDGSFEVLGRLDNSDIRGCSLMVV
jgi:hypothetical protein